ncbi:glycosyltransferase [Salinibacter ruber]|uniref:glycosyltransferase n=1 Tax=Salinibacter ruber TaxID=146919 RepID=UPI002168E8E9|nr:glycosyltransferase [Salinibacter ruber]MCS4054444.1 glycosyltransferase involved in cell wall biosynthesis [Salinibacter ruber]
MAKESSEICIVVPTMDGGVGVVNRRLAKGLSEKNFDITVVSLDCCGSEKPQEYELIEIGRDGKLKKLWTMWKIVRKQEPKHVVSSVYHTNIAAYLITKLAFVGATVSLVEHIYIKHDLHSSLSTPSIFIFRLVMSVIYQLADNVGAVSKEAAEELKKFLFVGRKVKTVYNPVITKNIYYQSLEEAKHKWHNSNDVDVVLSVGRLEKQKNYSLLLESFREVSKVSKRARLIILGDGKLKASYVEKATELGITEKVSFPGFVSNPYPYMKDTSVFVLSSNWEGLPTVLIEALSFPVPIVSTRCPTGPKEILDYGRYGELIPVDCKKAMVGGIVRALDRDACLWDLEERIGQYRVNSATSGYIEKFSLDIDGK